MEIVGFLMWWLKCIFRITKYLCNLHAEICMFHNYSRFWGPTNLNNRDGGGLVAGSQTGHQVVFGSNPAGCHVEQDTVTPLNACLRSVSIP